MSEDDGNTSIVGDDCAYLDTGENRLAYLSDACVNEPTIVFFSGFRSTMRGEKANHLSHWCRSRDLSFVRFDYSGHGQSSGDFADGTIGRWRNDALAVIDRLTAGPVVLVGSSMGAWIAVLAALARRDRVIGLLGVAAAPDFTEDLVPQRLGAAGMRQLEESGRLERPSAYSDEPDIITRALLEEGRTHLILRAPIALTCPLRLIHGCADADVPAEQSRKLLAAWQGSDAQLLLIKDGDHRLSRPTDLQRLTGVLDEMLLDVGVAVAKKPREHQSHSPR